MENIVKKNGSCDLAKGKILACLFYEPSTRTCSSFEAAMMRLGGQVIKINDMKNSSVVKGETLEDTIRCLESYVDILALRHPEKGASILASNVCSSLLILNGGDGAGEHPTQAMLDLFTIYREKGNIDNLTITFIGDLKYGRTVHSLIPALSLFKNMSFNLVSPEILELPSYILDEIKKHNHRIKISTQLDNELLKSTDVMYVTRVQKERFENVNDYEKVKSCYVINKQVLNKCKDDMIVMHPLPRVNEISTDIDDDPRSKYFKQMEYGMYARMALIALVLGL